MSEKDLATHLAMAFYLKKPTWKRSSGKTNPPIMIPFDEIGMDNACWENSVFVMETIERYYQVDKKKPQTGVQSI